MMGMGGGILSSGGPEPGEHWPEPAEEKPMGDPPQRGTEPFFDTWRRAGEGASSFVARMQLVRECTRSWHKAWRVVGFGKRREFAEAVIDYAINNIQNFGIAVVCAWLQEPGVWERLERKYITEEARQRLARAIVEATVERLRAPDREAWEIVRVAAAQAAERELGEIGRQQAVRAMGGEDAEGPV